MIRLRRWSDADWPILVRLNAPEMTEHLGGPEPDEALRRRQDRYLAAASSSGVFCYAVVSEDDGACIGNVSVWERDWNGQPVYEMGWAMVPELQGRGLATAAVKLAIQATPAGGERCAVHAFPSVENGPSNAVCRKAGFELIGNVQLEYPKGHPMDCNDWRLSLR